MIESFPGGVGSDDLRTVRCVTAASTDPDVLLQIRRPEVHLAIWHREPSRFLGPKFLRKLAKSRPFTAVAHSSLETVADRLCKQVPYPPPNDLLWDLTDLSFVFAAINDDPREAVRIQLDVQREARCSCWRADGLGLQMLCTYCGPGVEWLTRSGGAVEADVANGCGAHAIPASLAAGSVAILKSDFYPGNAGAGCVYRSPQVSSTDGVRLHVCIDQPGPRPMQ
jgi:hypothetical protein